MWIILSPLHIKYSDRQEYKCPTDYRSTINEMPEEYISLLWEKGKYQGSGKYSMMSLLFWWPKQPKWPKWIFLGVSLFHDQSNQNDQSKFSWVSLFLMTKATKVTKVNFLGVSLFHDQSNQNDQSEFSWGLSFWWPKQPKWPKWIFCVSLFLMTKATKVTKETIFLGVSLFHDQSNQRSQTEFSGCLSFRWPKQPK